MSTGTTSAKRLVRVTAGNIKNGHIYLNGAAGLFPKDCLGASSAKKGLGRPVELLVAGLTEAVITDLPRDEKSGRARGFFRKRSWVRRFIKIHGLRAGDEVLIERLGRYRFKIEPHRPRSKPTAAEFFAGIGLVRLALERQGWQVVFANDICPDKAEMYRHNWPNDDHLVVGDIHKIDAADVPTCDLFTASFPCNDLSIAGRWEGLNGRESSAFWGLIRILKDMGERRPRLVLLENVLGFLMRHGGADFEEALRSLNSLGYVTDAMVLNAVHWTPQSRARLFVIGRRNEGVERQTVAMECSARPDALCVFINTHPNIVWDIRPVPKLPRPDKRLVDVLEDLPGGDSHWWSPERAEYFMRQLSSKHGVEAKRMIAGRAFTYATAFRRVRNGKSMAELRTDGIAGCLRTPRGGSGRQILFKAGRGERSVRLLTARECARLQGVPDSYRIEVPLNKALFGFGDAVCVPAVEWILKECLTPDGAPVSGELVGPGSDRLSGSAIGYY